MSDTELAVLATILSEGTPDAFKIVAQQLRVEHFQVPKHRHAWKVMGKLAEKGFAVNLPSLAKHWNHDTIERPGLDFDSAIEKGSFPNIAICVHQGVFELVESHLKNKTNEIIQAYSTGGMSPRDLFDHLEKALSGHGAVVARRESAEVLDEFIKNAEDPQKFVSAGAVFGDSLLELEYGTYNIIGARPNVGKTALSMNYLSHLARKDKCLYVTAEMSDTALMRRFAACHEGIPVFDLKHPEEETMAALKAFRGHVIHKNITWADFSDSRCYIEDLVTMIDDSAKTQGTKVVIMDYVQQIKAREKFQRRRDEVAAISSQLKQIGKKHGMVVVILAQLRRPDAAQRDRRPRIDDLAECCDLEADADQILLIHRGYLEKESKYNTEGELIVGKSRDGETGKVDIAFEPRFCRFSINTEPEEDESDDEFD